MARLSKYCSVCGGRQAIQLELVPNGATYVFQAHCQRCGSTIAADGPPLRTADEIAAWVLANKDRTP